MKHVSDGCPSIDCGRISPDAGPGEVHDHPVSGPVVTVDHHISQLIPAGFDGVDGQHVVGNGGSHRIDIPDALTLVEALRGPLPAMHLEYASIRPRRSVEG